MHAFYSTPSPILNPRAQSLFKLLVEHYIKTGHPVGSKTLSDQKGVALSSATIRNVMALLEEKGLICSTHTSSGRIPTVFGYRFFVDQLLTPPPIRRKEVAFYQKQFDSAITIEEVIKTASSLLSRLTKLVGLVTLPRRMKIILRQIEFLPLSENRILAILVVNEADVHNRVLKMEHSYTPSELEQAANYLNTHYRGWEIKKMGLSLSRALSMERERLGHLVEKIKELAATAFQPHYVVEGQTRLLEFLETPNLKKICELFDVLEQKQILLGLIERCVANRNLEVFIGSEVPHKAFEDYALVAMPYTVYGETGGALAVMGPMRMPYERVIPMVHLTAELLRRGLEREEGFYDA